MDELEVVENPWSEYIQGVYEEVIIDSNQEVVGWVVGGHEKFVDYTETIK